MNAKFKIVLQAELLNRLHAAMIASSVDVMCNTGKGTYSLDVALHTGQFIYGNIAVCERLVPEEVIRKFGIEQIDCNSIEDIEDCVTWAEMLQSKHMVAHTVSMVA